MEYTIVDKSGNVILKFEAEKITDIFPGENFDMFYDTNGVNGEIIIDTSEYNTNHQEEKKKYDEGFNKGYKKGWNVGYKKGNKIGEMRGHDQGYSEGFEEGYNEGWSEEEESFFIKTGIDILDSVD